MLSNAVLIVTSNDSESGNIKQGINYLSKQAINDAPSLRRRGIRTGRKVC